MKTSFKMLASAFAVAVSFGAQAIVIDDFTVSQGLITDNVVNATGSSSSQNGPAANILGGQRDLFVIEMSDNGNTSTGVSMDVFGGELGFSNATGQAGVGIIRWDGSTNTSFGAVGVDAGTTLANAISSVNATGLGIVNLAGVGFGFVIEVISADLGFNFQLQAYSNANNWSSFTTSALGPGNFFIPFFAFTPQGSMGGANFASIGALQAIINYPGAARADVDLRVRLAEARIPEPATLALVGLALAGVGAAGVVRRNRRSA
jgi:hypothetical protein